MSNNLRIVADNSALRATLTSAGAMGALVAENLKNESKTEVWRSLGNSALLSVVWGATESVSMVSLPFCNLTSTSTIRVRGYTSPSDATPLFDTGDKLAVPYFPLGMFGWGTQPIGASSAGTGSAYATIWFPTTLVRRLDISIVDLNNKDGYIQAARLVTGYYWSPKLNADYGAALSMTDTTKNTRSDANELRSERGVRARKLKIDLKQMDQFDRARLWQVFVTNGCLYPVFISLYPDDADSTREADHQMLAKISPSQAVSHASYSTYSTSIEVEEV